MYIKQFQFFDIDENEQEIIPDFCEWLYLQIYQIINTRINRRKIQLRLNYIQTVRWMHWKRKDVISVSEILELIFESLRYKSDNVNRWTIYTNSDIIIPNSYTSMDRLIRFINFGDINFKGTGMFTQFENYFSKQKLNNLWRIFVNNRLGYIPQSKIEC